MGSQDLDKFLLKLIEDVSSIKASTSALKEQMDKLEDRIAVPFQEWVHSVKDHSSSLEIIREDIESLQRDVRVVDSNSRDISEIKTEIDEVKNQLKILSDKTNQVDQDVKHAKWYAAGVVAAVVMIVYCIYQALSLASGFIK